MRITIIKIDRSKVIKVGENALGYRAEFTCPLVSGSAILVPYSKGEEFIVSGAILSVETSQEGVAGFTILQNAISHSITRLPKEGDYNVVGTVSLNGDDEVFYIDVEDFTFILDIDETNGVIPQKGDVVNFVLHGLALWDENI